MRKWRNGRRTSLRGWRGQPRGGSNPLFRTIRLGLGSRRGLAHGGPSLGPSRVEWCPERAKRVEGQTLPTSFSKSLLLAAPRGRQIESNGSFPIISFGIHSDDGIVVHVPWVYIVRCSDDRLYIGRTDDIVAREAQDQPCDRTRASVEAMDRPQERGFNRWRRSNTEVLEQTTSQEGESRAAVALNRRTD